MIADTEGNDARAEDQFHAIEEANLAGTLPETDRRKVINYPVWSGGVSGPPSHTAVAVENVAIALGIADAIKALLSSDDQHLVDELRAVLTPTQH